MSRVNPREIDGVERREYLDLLWTSIAGLNSRDEVKSFFKDLLSESEAIMLARRIKIAQSLLEGQTYDEIMKEISDSFSARTMTEDERFKMKEKVQQAIDETNKILEGLAKSKEKEIKET